MSLPDRIADVITTHSVVILLSFLLVTAVLGSGVAMVDDESSLEQFETDSPEAEAAEDIEDSYAGDENTTSVQLIATDGNVLARESLRDSLELQEEIRNTDSINETLVEDDPIIGVENLVAITAITNQEIEALEQRGEELEQRAAELEQQGEELEQRSAELEQRIAELERRSAELDQRAAELADQERTLEQREAELEQQAAELEQRAADPDTDQAALAAEQRELEAQEAELESQRAELEAQWERLEREEEELRAERAQLEDEQDQLETDQEQLEAEQEQLEADQEQLEADWESLEDDEQPSLAEQQEILAEIDDEAFETALEDTLEADEDTETPALGLMPSDYEPGSTTADARLTSISQDLEGEGELGAADQQVVDSQLEIRDRAEADDQEYVAFGAGIITDEIDRSMADSLTIVGPLALLFVVVTLLIAYRDLLDIVLGVAGIVAVLLWTFGFMGWAGIAFNQMFVAVPVLLIGLSIDYAIHVFMRHRERRATEGAGTVRRSMAVALVGVGVALVWVTATTAIGFLANLVSPIGPIREFGIVSAFGICSALVVFGVLIPAAKVELDSRLEARGFDRQQRAFGTGGGRLSDALSVGAVAARRAPLVIVVLILVTTTAGVYGATQVDTSFEEEDFLAESPPAWTQTLPEPFAPGEYGAKADLEFVNENFRRPDAQAQILIRGAVTDDTVLERVNDTEDAAADSHVVYTLPNGEADVESPLSVMDRVAATNESFNESFVAADTDGDGVPDENIETLYDDLYAADEEAASRVIDRTDDGEYESIRLVIATQGDAAFDETTAEMRDLAAGIDSADDDDTALTAIATGDPIVSHIVEQELLETVFQSLAITLVSVFVFLTIAYWVTGNGATLGTVTLLPVAFAVAWILGTMYLIGMPFNVLTGMITSLTIGLGVAYSIHISARYTLELERQGNVWTALATTVTGTGGALAGSAATTIGGFGVLAVAILPVLRQFGIITAMTITYTFLASVIVLPTLLVGWTRYFGPDVSFDRRESPPRTPAASDGGHESTPEGED